MTIDHAFCRKLLNYKIEKETEKLWITMCILKIGNVEMLKKF